MVQELDEIRKTLFAWLIVFFAFAIFLFFFNIKKGLPVFSTDSISLTLFQKIYSDLVPKDIKLLITNPFNVLFVQIQVSLFFAFLLSLPVFLYRVTSYLSSALKKEEKKALKMSIIPSILLFFTGCLFAYFFLIPFTLRFMNIYVTSFEAATYFEINEFISFVLALILTSGLAFTLPIFMRTLSSLGLIDSAFWIRNFKYSLIAIVIFTAIITPDGTGVTMLMLSIPLISLYLLGWLLSKGVSYGT